MGVGTGGRNSSHLLSPIGEKEADNDLVEGKDVAGTGIDQSADYDDAAIAHLHKKGQRALREGTTMRQSYSGPSLVQNNIATPDEVMNYGSVQQQ